MSFDRVSMVVDDAERLLGALVASAREVRTDRGSWSMLLDDAHQLGVAPGAGAAAVDRLLGATATRLDDLAEDLHWRVGWVRGHGSDGVAVRIPRRTGLTGLTPAQLVARLSDGDLADRRVVLDELAVRVLLDPSVARVVAGSMQADDVAEFTHQIDRGVYEEFAAAQRSLTETASDAALRSLFETGGDALASNESWGVVLAAVSQSPSGRDLLRDAFGLDGASSDISQLSGLALPMLHGGWHGGFAAEVLEAVVAHRWTAGEFGAFTLWSTTYGLTELEPRLADPIAVVVEALARDQRWSRDWLLDGGLHRLLAVDPSLHLLVDHRFQIDLASRLDEATATLIRSGLIDPIDAPPDNRGRSGAGWHRDRVWWWLSGESDHPQLPARDDGGAFVVLAEHDLLGPASASAMADVVNLVWDRLAPVDNGDAIATTYIAAGMEEIVRFDEALAHLGFGYGVYVETLFTAAHADGSPEAIDDAIQAAYHGFEALDAGLDLVDVDDDSRAIFRQGLDAALGFGAKQALTRLGVAGGWLGVASGFLAGAAIDELLARALPAPVDDRRGSQSVLEELFLPNTGQQGSRQRQPAPANLALANAALAANPTWVTAIEPTPHLRDGVVVPPGGGAETDAFARWFHETFEDDGPREAVVFDLAEQLADRANVVTG